MKSCAGISVDEALLIETGLELDRAWMVVDERGEMLTQRELPRMALVTPRIMGQEIQLRAPGMLALHVRTDRAETRKRVRVWDDLVKAYDMGDLAAQWFSDFLGTRLRLVRFDPEQKRLADPQWAADVRAETAFADGFPLLVTASASLRDLNARLAARGAAPVGMQRFRPNLVLAGLQAFDEDHVDEILIDTEQGPVRLRLVKPCVRCSIPNIDPATAVVANEPGDTLAGFRADARVKGGTTFGMNAVIVEGFDCVLRRSQTARVSLKF